MPAFCADSGAIDYYTHTAQGHLDLHRAAGAGSKQTCGTIYDGTYDLGVLITEANRVLDRHSPRSPNATDPEAPEAPLDPLFLYLALHSVHEPNEVDPAWTQPYMHKPNPLSCPRQTMCGMIAAMDDGLGQLVDHWRSAKGETFWNNTIILFLSDNGGPVYPGAANKNLPLRGGKLTLFDGGMRVNAFAYSAGWLPSANGRVEKCLTHITDIIPTFVGLAGGSLTGSNGKLDGYDIWPTISKGAPSKRTEILHLLDPLGNDASVQVKGCVGSGDAPGKCSNSSAIRVGDFKLIVGVRLPKHIRLRCVCLFLGSAFYLHAPTQVAPTLACRCGRPAAKTMARWTRACAAGGTPTQHQWRRLWPTPVSMHLTVLSPASRTDCRRWLVHHWEA
jgi:hypothetical protein